MLEQQGDPAEIVTRYPRGASSRVTSAAAAAIRRPCRLRNTTPGWPLMTTALTPSPLDVVESDGHVEVTLEGPRGPVEVWLRETYSEPIFTMCRAHAPGPVRQWELIEVRGSTPLDNRISQPKV